MKRLYPLLLSLILVACQRTPSEVMDKVLVDFGVRAKPEGTVTETDRASEELAAIGDTELKRLNMESRHGTVKFEDSGDLKGKYYHEVRVYEEAFPLDAQPESGVGSAERGYVGYIEYSYRIYQSPRKTTRAEAEAESASIPTTETGRERYRYHFDRVGSWDGSKGERAKN